MQETTPEQILTLTADELFGSPILGENEDLVNISMITDTGLDELTNENADNTTYLSWEEHILKCME